MDFRIGVDGNVVGTVIGKDPHMVVPVSQIRLKIARQSVVDDAEAFPFTPLRHLFAMAFRVETDDHDFFALADLDLLICRSDHISLFIRQRNKDRIVTAGKCLIWPSVFIPEIEAGIHGPSMFDIRSRDQDRLESFVVKKALDGRIMDR